MSSTPAGHAANCPTAGVGPPGCFLARLVAASVRVSESAGELIKNIMNDGDLKVVDKNSVKGGPADLQTLADRSAQYMIVKSLQEKFNNRLTIIGEEDNTSRVEKLELGEAPEVFRAFEAAAVGGEIASIDSIGEQDVVIWVDPLDGTSEFVEAAKDKSPLLQQVTVLIGIAYHGRAFAGVVHQPYFDPKRELGLSRTIWGVKGVGVHGLGDHTPPQQTNANQDGERIGVTTRSHSTEQNTAALDALVQARLLTRVDKIGGAGYKVLKLLEGSAAYVHANAGTKKWDTAAPQAILEAAGGKLTDISGRNLYYGKDAQLVNTGGIMASAAGIDHQALVDCIPGWVKERLPEKTPSN